MDFFQSSSSSSSKPKPKPSLKGKTSIASSSSASSPSTVSPTDRPKLAQKRPPTVVVSTVRRKLPTPSSSSRPSPRPSASSPSARASPASSHVSRTATNALPPEVRARIEAARAAEREREIGREAQAQVQSRRAAKSKSGGTASAASKKAKSKRARNDDFIDSDEEKGVRTPSSSRGKRPRSKAQPAALDDDDDDDDGDDDDLFGSEAETKSTSRSRKGSRKNTPQAHAGSSSVYTYLGRSGVVQPYLVPRSNLVDEQDHAYAAYVAERGTPISGAQLVEQSLSKPAHRGKSFGPFFKDLATSPPPRCTLEYPAAGAQEDFILLVAKDRDDYDPISDLLRSVYVIVKHYVSAEKRHLFGELDELETGSAAGQLWAGSLSLDGGASPAVLTPAHEPSSAPSTPAHVVASAASSDPDSPSEGGPAATPASSAAAAAAAAATTASLETSILRNFTKSRNRRSGQLFLATVLRFNSVLATLRSEGHLHATIGAAGRTGLAEDVWARIQDQAYARTVAPRVEELASYRSFSDNVYGELTPRFMGEISQLCGLRPSSTMVDLGCGVGNLVIQSSLQAGCASFGIEAMPAPAELGVAQVAEAQKRWRMWALTGGEMAVWRGDFLEDEDTRSVMRRADVVIVNNYAFTPPLNESLSLLFLDLKDGCRIVSLKPFVPHDFRLTERTVGSPSAILAVQEREYGRGMVSWTERGGKYYISTVDRSQVKTFLESGAGVRLGSEAPNTPRKRRRGGERSRARSEEVSEEAGKEASEEAAGEEASEDATEKQGEARQRQQQRQQQQPDESQSSTPIGAAAAAGVGESGKPEPNGSGGGGGSVAAAAAAEKARSDSPMSEDAESASASASA